jgi:hypothetical protein
MQLALQKSHFFSWHFSGTVNAQDDGLQDGVEGHELREHVQQPALHGRRQTEAGQRTGARFPLLLGTLSTPLPASPPKKTCRNL